MGGVQRKNGRYVVELQGSAALEVSSDLNSIVRVHDIDNSFESDTTFDDNLSSAMNEAAAILT